MRPFLTSVLGWLRAGYPDGVPPKDYVPLLAVLHRKLTDSEAREVVSGLLAESRQNPSADAIETADIEASIARLTSEAPLEDDVRRVAVRLAAAGWPLAEESEVAG